MPIFTVEASYRLPVYRQRNYQAETVDEACRLAMEDDDWSGERLDYESAGTTIITGVWPGADAAYRVAALPVPAQSGETIA